MSDDRSRSFWICNLVVIVLAFGLFFVLLWSHPRPPLVDWPNHLARHYLEAKYLTGDELPPFYTFDYRVLPNLGGDVIVPFLIKLFGPMTGGQMFLSLAMLLHWLGPAWFILEVGGYQRASYMAALLFLPFLLSSQFFWGFLNYYSGLGFAFITLTYFMRSHRKGLNLIRMIILMFMISLLFLWHLAPWGIFGIMMACHILTRFIADWREVGVVRSLSHAVLTGLPALPSLGLFLVYTLGNEAVAAGANGTNWGTWTRKLSLPLTLFRTYVTALDVAFGITYLLSLILCFRADRGENASRAWLVLGTTSLVLLYLVIPFQVGSTSDADSRLLPAILVCVLAIAGTASVRYWMLGMVLLVVGLCLRTGSTWVGWDRMSVRLNEHVRSFATIEPGSRVLPLIFLPDPSKLYPEKDFLSWAVLDRDIFQPRLFANYDQQPLRIRQPYAACCEISATEVKPGVFIIDEAGVRKCYDYLWVYNAQDFTLLMPKPFKAVYGGNGLTVWKVQ